MASVLVVARYEQTVRNEEQQNKWRVASGEIGERYINTTR
jgi:hypothetical protein